MVPALHQDLNPARGGKFVEFVVKLFPAQDIMVFVFFRPVERAELAVNVADVRVIDVAIDDVSHDLTATLVIAGRLGQIAPRVGQRAQRLKGKLV
jgi:hypothetical protein